MTRRNIIIGSIAAVVLILTGFLIWGGSDDSASNNSTDGSSQISDSENPAENTETGPQNPVDEFGNPDIKQNPDLTPVPVDPENPRDVTITRSNVNNGVLTVAAIVDGALIDDQCTLNMNNSGGQNVSFTNGVVYQSSYYSCQNFQISQSDLPTGGEWTLQIVINGQASLGASDERTITF